MNKKIIKLVLNGYYPRLLMLGIFILINSLLSVAVSSVMLMIIDKIIPQGNMKMLFTAIAGYLALILVQLIFSFSCNYIKTIFMLTVTNKMRGTIVDSIYTRSGSFLTSISKGELYAAVDSDSTTLCSFVIESIFSIIYTLCSFFVSIIYLGILNWKLLLIIVCLQPFAIILQTKMSPIITKLSRKNRNVIAEYSSALQNVVSSPEDLKISGFKKYIIGKYEASMDKILRVTKKLVIVDSINDHLVEFINSVTTCAVIAFGGFSIIDDSMSIGILIIFLTQTGKLIQACSNVLDLSIDFSEIKPILERIKLYTFKEKSTEKKVNDVPKSPDIEFKDVIFSYDGVKQIYDKLNVRFVYGKNYGIIGRTGEGKSTFVKLVYNLWKPASGNVMLGDTPVNSFDEEQIEKIVSYVSSDPFFIEGTVRENILMGKEGISDDRIEEVLEKICMLDEVNKMDNGLDTVIGGDGATISSGQRQRIALARAILSKKEIVVLDEPTSAIDTATEEVVIRNIYSEFADSTLIIITHDENILYGCNRIFKLENGKMTESSKRS